ncbi:MAG: hypothetical protein H7831_18805 [Magnetococcus sp. WYHC-3]
MFRPIDHQISLDEAHFWMPEGHREALERSWPHVFRTQVLKMIPESRFAEVVTVAYYGVVIDNTPDMVALGLGDVPLNVEN